MNEEKIENQFDEIYYELQQRPLPPKRHGPHGLDPAQARRDLL
jgi:hypothetical protein